MQSYEKHVAHIFVSLALLLISLAIISRWDTANATELQETIIVGEEKEWTHYDEFNRIYEQTAPTEKQKVVQQVEHRDIKWPKYTIKVGAEWKRKPIPSLQWETIEKRAEEFLNVGWLWDTIYIWNKLWSEYKIDFTLPICIAWADSHLWKALASKNNIGNVGNNDRGDRVHYETMEAWINAIFRALNNKWMWGSTIVWQLSWEGRKRLWIEWCHWAKSNQKCYATSMTVWSTNVTNCMSAIHDKQIDESYEFRF